MTMRKPNYAQQIAELKNEIATVEAFIAPIVRECEQIDTTRKERRLTPDELKRADELINLIHEKNVWLVKAKEKVNAFFKPVAA